MGIDEPVGFLHDFFTEGPSCSSLNSITSPPEQHDEARRIFDSLRQSTEDELWRISQLLASKPDDKLLGKTEFEVRDRVHTIGVKAIETALNERKKGATKGPV